jgi:predicted acylesterase/phospholipase RssA
MKALFEGSAPTTFWQPMDPAILTGTSAGSFNASVLSSLPELPATAALDYLQTVWLERVASMPNRCGNGIYRIRGDLSRLVNPACIGSQPIKELDLIASDTAYLANESLNRARDFLTSDATFAGRAIELFNLSTLISTEPFYELLQSILRPAAIQASHRMLCIALTDWKNGALQLFWNQSMTDQTAALAVMASSALPGFFPPVTLGDNVYVDGGVLMNTPLRPAIDAGADFLHVIYLDPIVSAIPTKILQSTISTFDRIQVIQRAALINSDVARALRVNQELTALETLKAKTGGGGNFAAFEAIATAYPAFGADSQPHRKLTVHRYHPHEDLGTIVGMLNFDRTQLENLMAKGYESAINHDCNESECVMPNGLPAPKRFA